MKKRIVFAILIVVLLAGLASLIPNQAGTAYPPPNRTPMPPEMAFPEYAANDCRRPMRYELAEWINPPIEAYLYMPNIGETTGYEYYEIPPSHIRTGLGGWTFWGCQDYYGDIDCIYMKDYRPPAGETYLLSGYVCNDDGITCFNIQPYLYDVPCEGASQYSIFMPVALFP